MEVLRLENVRKSYSGKEAVRGVSFQINEGAIFGLLGPNGAGKTSIIRIITTITGADEGEVYFYGTPLNERHPEAIGYLPEERGLYKKMKVGDHLLYLARLKGFTKKQAKTALQEWMTRFDIMDWWGKRVDELSKGMQQKIQFISTIIHEPKLLILDEPFSGLDPLNTNLIKDEIRRLRDEGTTIIFSTHRMEQVEEICEEIVLISNGKKILSGKVNEIKQRYKENNFEVELDETENLNIDQWADIINISANKVKFHLKDGHTSKQVLSHLITNGFEIKSFNEILPSLNEVFIKQVNEDTPTAIKERINYE